MIGRRGANPDRVEMRQQEIEIFLGLHNAPADGDDQFVMLRRQFGKAGCLILPEAVLAVERHHFRHRHAGKLFDAVRYLVKRDVEPCRCKSAEGRFAATPDAYEGDAAAAVGSDVLPGAEDLENGVFLMWRGGGKPGGHVTGDTVAIAVRQQTGDRHVKRGGDAIEDGGGHVAVARFQKRQIPHRHLRDLGKLTT